MQPPIVGCTLRCVSLRPAGHADPSEQSAYPCGPAYLKQPLVRRDQRAIRRGAGDYGIGHGFAQRSARLDVAAEVKTAPVALAAGRNILEHTL